jgi:membrane protein
VIKDTIRRGREFLFRDLWTKEPPPGWRGAPFWLARTIVLVGEGVWKQDLLVRAAALTYKVVFAIVPFFAVILALFKGFNAFQQYEPKVKQWLVNNLAPGVADQVMNSINEMIANTDARAIGFVGFALLIYTAISLLTTVEHSFNVIWNVRRPRGFIRRLTIFWTLLTLGPICIAGSIALSSFVQNQKAYDWMAEHIPYFSIVLTAFVPWLLTWTVFAAMYLIMPNTTVSFRASLVGAIVAGSIWEILKRLYIAYNANLLASYEVYGPLSAIPILLLWLYISWIIVLFGAELVFAIQHVKTYEREMEAPKLSQAFKERLGLYVMLEVSRDFLGGKEAPGGEQLADRLKAPVRAVNDVLYTLLGSKIVREIPNGQLAGYIPAEDPERFTVKRVLDAMRKHGDEPAIQDGAAGERLAAALREAEDSSTRALEALTMRQLATQERPA